MMHRLTMTLSILMVWWGITAWTQIPPFLLPTPGDVFTSFINHGAILTFHTAFSLMEILTGLSLGLGISVLLTFVFARKPSWSSPTLHLLTALQAVPIFALLPLLILWLGHGVMTKIFVVSLSCFFPITIAGLSGLNRIAPAYHDLALLFQARSFYQFRHVELPALLPYLMTGFRLAAVHAPVTVIAADWIGATQGLGYLIMLASGRLQVDLLFAGIICLIGLSLSLNKCCNYLNKKLIYWNTES